MYYALTTDKLERLLNGTADAYDRRCLEDLVNYRKELKKERENAQEKLVVDVYNLLSTHPGIAYTCTDLVEALPAFRNTQKVSGYVWPLVHRTRNNNPAIEGATLPVYEYGFMGRTFYCAGDLTDFADSYYSNSYKRRCPVNRYKE